MGWDPLDTIQGSSTSLYVTQANKAGCKIISIDPILTDTVKAFADEWIPIRLGTDAAMMAAIAYVIITEELHDQNYFKLIQQDIIS